MNQRAIVVFVGSELVDGASWYARFLEPGFVHCFVLIESSDRWIKLEGSYGVLRVTQLDLNDDVHEHYMRYVSEGATLVKTDVSSMALISPFMARTCVGVIKSALGLRSLAVTPFQLYKHLRSLK